MIIEDLDATLATMLREDLKAHFCQGSGGGEPV